MSAIDPNSIPTAIFDWGAIKWFVSPSNTDGAVMTVGEVVLLPGKGHDRHNHPDAEEVLYVLAGEGKQMVADGEPFPVKAGDVIFVPTAVFPLNYQHRLAALAPAGDLQPRRLRTGPAGSPRFPRNSGGKVPGMVLSEKGRRRRPHRRCGPPRPPGGKPVVTCRETPSPSRNRAGVDRADTEGPTLQNLAPVPSPSSGLSPASWR